MLFELVYSWENYLKNKKGELFSETVNCTKIDRVDGHWKMK